MNEEFIPKDFYIEPPKSNSTEKEWTTWLRKETRKQAAHKAAHTRSIAQQPPPDSFFGDIKKINGVWKQSASFGFSGTEDEVEIVSTKDSSQEKDMILIDMELNRHKRGGSKKGKGARRRRNKRNKKANK